MHSILSSLRAGATRTGWSILLAVALSLSGGAAAQAQFLAFVDPASAVKAVNLQHTIVLQVFDLQTAQVVPSLSVSWRVVLGPNAGTNGSATTNGSGFAFVSYSGTGGVGHDTVVFTTTNGELLIATASVEWFNVSATLAPPTDTNQVSTQHSVTCTVFRSGIPHPNVTVSFAVRSGTGSPNVGSLGSAVTNANGQASVTYTSNGVIGTDTIRANGVLDGVAFVSNDVFKTWIDVACSLTPTGVTNRIGTSHTTTATVLRNGSPQSGVTVDFVITSGPNEGVQGQDVTDANGHADFTYVGSETTGTDVISSSGQVSGVPFSCTATKTWSNTTCDMTPAFGSSLTGLPYSVTANVKLNGLPASNATVQFSVISGPNVGAGGPVVTNGAGNATFTYSGSGLGADTIRASGNINGAEFECTAIHSIIFTTDCNSNGIDDACDLTCGAPGGPCDIHLENENCGESLDDNFNGFPDECEIVLLADGPEEASRAQDPAVPGVDGSSPTSILSPAATCSAGAFTLTPLTLASIGLLRRRIRRR